MERFWSQLYLDKTARLMNHEAILIPAHAVLLSFYVEILQKLICGGDTLL